MTDRYENIRQALADMDAAAEARNALAWGDAHARFVAHVAPDTIRALLAESDALREALRELEEREQRDEALLRQALEALELRCGTHADERKELIPALRERLGEETGHE